MDIPSYLNSALHISQPPKPKLTYAFTTSKRFAKWGELFLYVQTLKECGWTLPERAACEKSLNFAALHQKLQSVRITEAFFEMCK